MTRRGHVWRVTRSFAPCSWCGRPIPPGEGHVYRCLNPGKCAAPEHCRNGYHALCLDEQGCKARVVAAMKRGSSVVASSEQVEIFEERAAIMEHDGEMQRSVAESEALADVLGVAGVIE